MHPIVRRRASRGMTLIEVLIAIVIFAIGLLGIAALQVAGLRYTKSTQTRTIAVLQAENLADRMRANLVAVADGNYESPQNPATDCSVDECTPKDMADYDWARWLEETRLALGSSNSDANVNATVCIDNTPEDGDASAWACDATGNVFAIKIQWIERSTERSGKLSDTYASSGAASGVDGFVTNRFVMRFVP